MFFKIILHSFLTDPLKIWLVVSNQNSLTTPPTIQHSKCTAPYWKVFKRFLYSEEPVKQFPITISSCHLLYSSFCPQRHSNHLSSNGTVYTTIHAIAACKNYIFLQYSVIIDFNNILVQNVLQLHNVIFPSLPILNTDIITIFLTYY